VTKEINETNEREKKEIVPKGSGNTSGRTMTQEKAKKQERQEKVETNIRQISLLSSK
jgi:hypothetical protein